MACMRQRHMTGRVYLQMHDLAYSGRFLQYSLTLSQTPKQDVTISTDVVQTDGKGAIMH